MIKGKMDNCSFNNNGGAGMKLIGDVDIEMNNVHAHNNAHGGLEIGDANIYGVLGLKESFDSKELAQFLYDFQSKTAEERNAELEKPEVKQKLIPHVHAWAGFVANILKIGSDPHVTAAYSSFIHTFFQ